MTSKHFYIVSYLELYAFTVSITNNAVDIYNKAPLSIKKVPTSYHTLRLCNFKGLTREE